MPVTTRSASAAALHPTKTSRRGILALPAELRNHIYSEVFSPLPIATKLADGCANYLQPLLTCNQIYSEAYMLAYNNAGFVLPREFNDRGTKNDKPNHGQKKTLTLAEKYMSLRPSVQHAITSICDTIICNLNRFSPSQLPNLQRIELVGESYRSESSRERNLEDSINLHETLCTITQSL
ncbi:hypothetical protein EJ08DRAFT_707357 [Tothia fuscella]|uniref:Uncharacterized protein n=1 Tax=Tothia fuscella TaxID=1048955 RepID=A0A9P4NEV9_9PEZI|nr:hypothetical protein EJ08DRAFT_707357 [Tothia fuscella]